MDDGHVCRPRVLPRHRPGFVMMPNRPTPRTPFTSRSKGVLIPGILPPAPRRPQAPLPPPRRSAWTPLATSSEPRFPAPDEGFGGVWAANVV